MKLSWRDSVASLLALGGATVVYARLGSYTWWLIGSWRGALGAVAGIGIVIAGLYSADCFDDAALSSLSEMLLWLAAATVTIGSLFADTTKAEFLTSAAFIAMAWLAQLGAHTWDSAHSHASRMVHS